MMPALFELLPVVVQKKFELRDLVILILCDPIHDRQCSWRIRDSFCEQRPDALEHLFEVPSVLEPFPCFFFNTTTHRLSSRSNDFVEFIPHIYNDHVFAIHLLLPSAKHSQCGLFNRENVTLVTGCSGRKSPNVA